MLPSFLLSLREGLEAALIIGIVIGVLQRINRRDLITVVWRGAGAAAGLSALAAVLLNLFGAEFEGKAEEIYEGIAMLLAAIILTWMIFWMRRQSSSLKQNIESDVRKAAAQGGARAVWLLSFLAVGREGLELSLFLTASYISSNVMLTILGAFAGLLLSALLGYSLFRSTRQLSLKTFFQVTNVLLILFAAGLVAHGVHEFNEAGLISPVVDEVWNLNPILDEDSTLGSLLKALFGYNGNPSLSEVIAYFTYFILVWILFRRHPASVLKTQEIQAEI